MDPFPRGSHLLWESKHKADDQPPATMVRKRTISLCFFDVQHEAEHMSISSGQGVPRFYHRSRGTEPIKTRNTHRRHHEYVYLLYSSVSTHCIRVSKRTGWTKGTHWISLLTRILYRRSASDGSGIGDEPHAVRQEPK